jgi:hypothetical protein
MTDVHAAIGRVQLTQVDEWTWQRHRNAAFLTRHLEAVVTPTVATGARHVFHQYRIRVLEDRDGSAAALRDEHRIGSGLFYPTPVRFAPFASSAAELPETDRAARECLSLPVHPRCRNEISSGSSLPSIRWRGPGRCHESTARRALIGLGMMGRNHLRVLSSLDGVELVPVADALRDPHQLAAGRTVLADVDEVIAAKVDYCTVGVPTQHHVEVGLALAEAGVHALIEKPLAHDVPSARKLAEAFEAAAHLASWTGPRTSGTC